MPSQLTFLVILRELALGSLVIAVTVAIHAELFAMMTHRFDWLIGISRRRMRRFANTGLLIGTVLFILAVLPLDVWIWAYVLWALGAVEGGFEPALYFSLVSFTTVGFGDITLAQDWRILSALISVNGLILFGWSTAYMVEIVRRTA